jgi:precorrin-6B methylase 2
LALPKIVQHSGVAGDIVGSYLLWHHLFEEGVGAHQRCLDVGSGTGLQTVQLSLNGASHVHAIDVDDRAVANTLDNAFRNGVADRVTAEVADIYPWLPTERYEVVVANLPELPVDPLADLASHRPTDYWGRGLVDQVIGKLPQMLAPEGHALLTFTSLLSRTRTMEALDAAGLSARVVAWRVDDLPDDYHHQAEHLVHVQQLSDAYIPSLGDREVLITYLLDVRHTSSIGEDIEASWNARH